MVAQQGLGRIALIRRAGGIIRQAAREADREPETAADADHFTRLIANETVAANGYNIAVSSYVEAKDTREATDITAPRPRPVSTRDATRAARPA